MGTHHQPFFLEKAAEDLVHHSASWVVKQPGRSPIFVDCHAVEDPSLDRGGDLRSRSGSATRSAFGHRVRKSSKTVSSAMHMTPRVSPKHSPASRVPSPKFPITSSRRSWTSMTRTT